MKQNQWPLTFALLGFGISFAINNQQQTTLVANAETIAKSPAEAVRALPSSDISLLSKPSLNNHLSRISFEKTACDLGDVGQGTKNSCESKFTNTGRGLLKIGKISRTCGCTVFQLDKKEYAPNEIIHSFWPAYKRPFLWPCGRRPVFATKFTLQANPAENTKLVTKQRKSA